METMQNLATFHQLSLRFGFRSKREIGRYFNTTCNSQLINLISKFNTTNRNKIPTQIVAGAFDYAGVEYKAGHESCNPV